MRCRAEVAVTERFLMCTCEETRELLDAVVSTMVELLRISEA